MTLVLYQSVCGVWSVDTWGEFKMKVELFS